MNTPILALLLAFVAFSQIGCSDKKKPTDRQKAMINACMYDPSGRCQLRAKAMLENPAMQAQLGQQLSGWNGNGPPPVLPVQLEQRAQQVQAAIKADSENPRSLYYDPPQGSSVVDRTPAATANNPPAADQAAADIQVILPASVSSGGSSGDGAIR